MLDKAVIRFRREGIAVEVLGLDAATASMVDRFGIHHEPHAAALMPAH